LVLSSSGVFRPQSLAREAPVTAGLSTAPSCLVLENATRLDALFSFLVPQDSRLLFVHLIDSGRSFFFFFQQFLSFTFPFRKGFRPRFFSLVFSFFFLARWVFSSLSISKTPEDFPVRR